MSQRILFCIVTFMSIASLILIVVAIVKPSLDIHLPSDVTHACTLGLDLSRNSFVVDWSMGIVYFTLQVSMLLFGLIRIRNVSPKYGVKEELFLVLFLWTICWVAVFSINIIDQKYHVIYKMLYNVNLTTIFTFSVTFWIFKSKKYIPIEETNQNSLIYEYPEALYLWMPNFYFHRYLLLNSPDLVAYRPFLADVLRYDYQALEEYKSEEEKTEYLQQLAQYIWARYL